MIPSTDGVGAPPFEGGCRIAEQSHRTKGLLRLTMACNERCPFCNVPMEDYRPATPPAAQIDAELQQFLDAGAQTLTISGGEPTLLRKQLVDLVTRARAGGVSFVELQTNAILIDDGYAAELAEAGVTSAFVSLLSHVPELHDELAGLEGAFPRCIAGIDALVAHGIRVTLNPVTAYQTQALLADYIDFVAERLPQVQMVSVSAVQPHGRGRDNLELLPDYAVLADAVRQARERAAVADIELVNPYCGLPACIGWEEDLDRSVEAFESRAGGWQDTPGIENRGDKSQGAPCLHCALRMRCGGAWHAYWEHRNGSGIAAPIVTEAPWFGEAGPGQQVVSAPAGLDAAALASLEAARSPTVWVHASALRPGDAERLAGSACTDLALELDVGATLQANPTLRELRKLLKHEAQRLPVWHRRRVHVALYGSDPTARAHAVRLARALGVFSVHVLEAA